MFELVALLKMQIVVLLEQSKSFTPHKLRSKLEDNTYKKNETAGKARYDL